MTADDFGFFTEQLDGCYYRFGVDGDNQTGKLHTSTFLIDENALRVSTSLFAFLPFEVLVEEH